ncbi:MAG: hypothetical protein ACOZBL_06015 [Patescibacteria group bacterium]
MIQAKTTKSTMLISSLTQIEPEYDINRQSSEKWIFNYENNIDCIKQKVLMMSADTILKYLIISESMLEMQTKALCKDSRTNENYSRKKISHTGLQYVQGHKFL